MPLKHYKTKYFNNELGDSLIRKLIKYAHLLMRVVYDEMIGWLMEWDRSHWASLACVGTVGDLNILLPPLHHSQHDTKPVRKNNRYQEVLPKRLLEQARLLKLCNFMILNIRI